MLMKGVYFVMKDTIPLKADAHPSSQSAKATNH